MTKTLTKLSPNDKTLVPYIIGLLAAIVFVTCIFLPYFSVADGSNETVTLLDLTELAFEAYEAGEESTALPLFGIFFLAGICVTCVSFILALVFLALKKTVGVIVFDIIAALCYFLLNFLLTSNDIGSSETFHWGFAYYALPVAFVLLLVASVVMLRLYPLGVKATRRVTNSLVYIVLVLMTVIWLFPFFGIVMESFKVGEGTGGMDGRLFPEQWGFDNYIRLFKQTNFLKWFGNTALMGICTALFQTLFVLMMSYTLSRLRFKGRKLLMNFMLILGMFPGFLTLVLIYKVFSDWGMTMEMAPIGLIIVYCASSGMGYYISKGFFDTIPKSLDEAARVDGATRLQVFYKVIMPLSGSIIIYTLLMGFMAPWGDFMMAKYIAHARSDGFNVAVGMWSWLDKTSINANYTMFCAAGVVVAVPVTAIFLMLQKYYVEGVTGGAVKG